jgi:hypothetical protein
LTIRITSFRISGIVLKKTSGKTKNKMEVRRPEWHIRDHRNKRIKEMGRRQKGMEASSEEGRVQKGLRRHKWNGMEILFDTY